METRILKKISERVNKGEKAALVILENNQGSVPGKEGSLMAVFQDGTTLGTVGGGAIEYNLVKRTLEAIDKNENFKFDYALTEESELKMVCGGQAQGFVKIFIPKNKLIIFGAGHCAQKLARIAANTNFSVTVIDDREEFKELSDFDRIDEYLIGTPKEVADKLNFDSDSTYIVIATRGHTHDIEAAKEVINREYKYLGIMGSRKKSLEIKKKLVEEGFDKELVNRTYSPIGLDISDGSIEEIAISIMSEILKVKNGLEAKSRKIEI